MSNEGPSVGTPRIAVNPDTGAFELYDEQGNGLCCDGDGNVVLSNSGE